MKIIIITDTFKEINGVVTTLVETKKELELRGHTVYVIEPSMFKTIKFYSYPDVHLSWNVWKIKKLIDQFLPDAVHIATEGPLGLAARLYLRFFKKNCEYTTGYHTKFPEYLKIYFGIPLLITYSYLKWFHRKSYSVLITTASMKHELELKGFKNLVIWSRGVNTQIFYPNFMNKNHIPKYLCVSRVSKEKNLDDFCKLNGHCILVGDGPYLSELKEKYPTVEFVGFKTGSDLAEYYRAADVFVFPSRSDTFGVVMIEALACGIPVAAYNVTGPKDIVTSGLNGYLGNDLQESVNKCLSLDKDLVYQSSKKWSWKTTTDTFEKSLRFFR